VAGSCPTFASSLSIGLAQALAGQLDAIGVADDAVEDGVGERGDPDPIGPAVDGNLTGDGLSRRELFEKIERAALNALPAEDWEFAEWRARPRNPERLGGGRRFRQRPNLPPTNNDAERALRHAVIARRTSFGTRTDEGSRFYAAALNVVDICRKRGASTSSSLSDLVGREEFVGDGRR
jgi:hypothetical protein